jgi:hypothetical protein
MVEQLIVFIPLLFFFLATFQLIEVMTGNLVVKRAAMVAVRAATVVLPDDPDKYGGAPLHEFSGARRDAIYRATQMILSANPHLDPAAAQVSITGASGNGPVTATVETQFRCFARFVNVICGGSSMTLKGVASDAYHGANYVY